MPLRLPTPALIALIALAVAVLLSLGVWQVQRNTETSRLVAERNAALAGAPLAAEEARALPLASMDYRLVTLEGRWDYEHAMILANRARFSTKGEELVVPLLLTPDGPAVLINRGWYAEGQREHILSRLPELDAEARQPAGCFDTPSAAACDRAEGLARYVEGLDGRQTPAGTWTQLSTSAMGATVPYEVQPWFVIEGPMLVPGGGTPPGLLAQGFFPYISTTPHLEYAATWFGIAAVLVAIAIIRFFVAPRRERRAAAGGAPPANPAASDTIGRDQPDTRHPPVPPDPKGAR